MSKKTLFLTLAALGALTPTLAAQAVCPVCTVAVMAGVGLSRWLGVDDTISGFWIGAVLLSSSLWTINWLNKKNIHFKGRKILIFLSYYLIVLLPLYQTEIIGHPYNKIWGMDKIVFGTLAGSLAFWAGSLLHSYLKKKNGNKSYFPLQSTVVPIVILLLLSAAFYFITK